MSVVREPAARAWFAASTALGWLLRSARYATAQIVHADGARGVR